MPPRTSFLLPARDAAATIGEALASLVAQTDPDWEAVVVDDGSADDTAAIAQGNGDPRIRVLRQPPLGLVAALERGRAACRGTFVARMDADDVAATDRLARQLPWFDADPGLAVVDGGVRFFRDAGEVPDGMRRYEAWINAVVTPDDFDRELLIESPVVHPAATIRADALAAVGGYREGPFPEDYDLWLRLHAAGWRLRKVDAPLVAMRDRPTRLTRTDPRYGPEGFRRVRRAWLAATVLPRRPRLVLLGGGKEARAWAGWLVGRADLVAIVDVDPARIGRARHGVPVVGVDALAGLQADLGLAVVSARGREAVRALLAAVRPGWVEGRDWWCLR